MSFVIHVAFAYAIELCLMAFKIYVNAIFESLNVFHIYIFPCVFIILGSLITYF